MAKKAKTPDPLSEIAADIVSALESRRSVDPQTPAPFLTWSQLVASLNGVSMEWATAALKKSPAKGNVVIAVVDDLKSPVALQKDLERLAQDPSVLQRLVQHPSTGCSEAVPVRPVSELCRSLNRNLRKLVELYLAGSPQNLPRGLSLIQNKSGKKSSWSIHDERFVRTDVALSRRLLAALESLQKSGESSYPAIFGDVLARAEVEVHEPLLSAACSLPPFADAAMLVAGKLPDGWLALRRDAEQAVSSEEFLRRLVMSRCSEATPEVKLSALGRILAKDLQHRFTEVWRTHFDLHRRLSFIELSAAGSKARPDVLLRDSRYPRAETVLSEQLVRLLEGQKSKGPSAYPMTWDRLIQLAKSPAKATLKKSTAIEPFTKRVILAFPASADSPVAFADDAEELAASAMLLGCLISHLVTESNQGVPAEKLAAAKGLHPLLKPHVRSAVDRFISTGQLPTGFGALRISRKWYVFRMSDVTAGTALRPNSEPKARPKKGTPESGAAATPEQKSEHKPVEGFTRDLEAAFDRLSESSRLPGCVNLADLRPALSQYSRDVFDTEMIRLRRSGQYSLSVVEGRYPLSDAERDACLVVDNEPHLLVRRRTS